jgi:hypothetical protein
MPRPPRIFPIRVGEGSLPVGVRVLAALALDYR